MPTQSIAISAFGGLNSKTSDFLRKDYEASDLQNVVIDSSWKIVKRNGYSKANSNAITGTTKVLGLHEYIQSDGTIKWLSASKQDVWKSDDDPDSWSSIQGSLTTTLQTFFVTYLDYVYFGNGTDDSYQWNGTIVSKWGGPDVSDMTLTAQADANNDLDANATYQYKITFVLGDGTESNASGMKSEDTTTDYREIALAGIPTGPSDCIGRNIYRTLGNETDVFYRLSADVNSPTIGDNTTTTYEDHEYDDTIDDFSEEPTDIPPKASRYFKLHKNRLFVAGNTNEPSRLYYSDINDDFFRPTSYINVARNDGDVITGLAILHDNLIIFKRNSIYILSGSTNANFVLRKAPAQVGCYAPRTIIQLENEILFLHRDGVYSFDGAVTRSMSDQSDRGGVTIRDKTEEILPAYIDIACAAYYKGQAWFSWCTTGTVNNKTFTYHVATRQWSYYNYGMNCFYVSKTGTLYAGGVGGFVFQLDNGNNDNTANITAYWQSKYYDLVEPGVETRLMETIEYAKIVSGTLDTVFSIMGDYATRTSTHSNTSVGTSINEIRFSNAGNLTGKRHRFKITNTGSAGAFEVERVILRHQPIQRR